MKGALGISCSPELKFRESVSQFHQTLLGRGGCCEPYSEPSQQVEEAEVTGESLSRPHPHAWCCEKSDL